MVPFDRSGGVSGDRCVRWLVGRCMAVALVLMVEMFGHECSLNGNVCCNSSYLTNQAFYILPFIK